MINGLNLTSDVYDNTCRSSVSMLPRITASVEGFIPPEEQRHVSHSDG